MSSQALELGATIVVKPTLNLTDLGDSKKVANFVRKIRSYIVTHPETRMYDGVAGDCWSILSEWNEQLFISDLEIDGNVQTGYFPDDEVLAACLLDLYNLGEGEGARESFKKIKMKVNKSGVVCLEDVMSYQIQWSNCLKDTLECHMPQRVDLVKWFIAGVSHEELRSRLKTEYESEKSSAANSRKFECRDIKDWISRFVKLAKELAQVLARANIILRRTSDKSSNSSPSDDFQSMVTSAVKNSLKTLNTSVKGKSTSRSRKRGSAHVASDDSSKAVKQGDMVCYGCANEGHGRNNCPYKDHKDFCKFPKKCTKRIVV
jgi:hypothetical protein